MIKLFYLFAVSAALACILAGVSVWSHRKLWIKVAAVATTALFLPAAYLSYADLLSRPKPASLEWWHRDASQATVIGSQLREGENIYLWLQMEGTREPRAYELPWQEELARQLHGAQREAEGNGTEVRMRSPFNQQPGDQEPLFYAEPQPTLPPKQVSDQSPIIFHHSRSTRYGERPTGPLPLTAQASVDSIRFDGRRRRDEQ